MSNPSQGTGGDRKFLPRVPGASGAAPAPAKKKASMPTFTPNIPGSTSKATTSTSAAPSSVPKFGGQRGPNRALGAPPGHSRAGFPKHGMRPGGPRPGGPPGRVSYMAVGTTPMGGSSSSSATSGATSSETKSEPKARKEKQYEQQHIAPTAQSMAIDPLNLQHPMTLPFLDPLKANPTLKKNELGESEFSASTRMDEDTSLRASSAVTSTSIAAAASVRSMGAEAEKSNPASLMFRNDDGDYVGEDQLFFVQMPSALPFGDIPVRPPSAVEQFQVLGFNGNLEKFPSGRIGKLLVYKSGKVKMQIGDQQFDVSTGMPCNFLQEVVAINTDRKKYYQLGDISRRMVCYPDIDFLLDGPPKPEFLFDPSSMDVS